MKKHFSILLAAMIIVLSLPMGTFTLSASAEVVSGTCGKQGDNLIWEFDTETGVLTISGSGEMEDYDFDYSYDCEDLAPWYYEGYVREVIFIGEITSIGDYAFWNCSGVPSIVIPNSVTSIGEYAFYDCSGLTSINLPNGVASIGEYAFFGCSSLTEFTISDDITNIGDYAFAYCLGLTSIDIPEGVASIGYGAFRVCSNLKKITVNKDNKYYHASENCLIETASKKLIAGCMNSIIPDDGSVTDIGDNAFSGRRHLYSIAIPDSVTSIGNYAFSGCSGLTSINIPNSVTSIGDYAFEYCSGLTSVAIPNSVISISDFTFSFCTNLTSITIPNSVTSIGNHAFSYCLGLTSVAIPNSVTNVGEGAFAYNTALTSITIPKSVTSIEWYAFCYCSNLTDVYYAGSEDDRNNIDIGDFNDYLLNATWHYNYIAENPLTTLGAKINIKKQALRMGATYDRNILNAIGIDAADVIDMGIVFCPAKFVTGELTLDIDEAIAVSAAGVENYDPEKVFEDYESLTFYATIVNIPVNGLGTDISFRAYLCTADRIIYADDTLTRSYNYVHEAIYGSAPGAEDATLREGDNGIICHTDWWN